MAKIPIVLSLFALVLIMAGSPRAAEPPMLAAEVADGRLPPLSERLPAAPRRDLPARADWTPGRYGGTLKTLTRGGRDARDLVVLGYARLMAWSVDADGRYALVPDILERVAIEDGRVFTLHLRPGHRWSDGAPFTSEDVRFWWEDVANDPALSPAGPPAEMLAGGAPPRVTVLDETRVRFAWDRANPRFLPALAATSPLFIYRPAHYLRPFHARYADAATLDRAAQDEGLGDWAALFQRRDRPFLFDNPARPTLQPWVNTSAPPAERYVAVRNPYFHRVDATGRQLPYIDRVVLARTQAKLIPAQAAAGESDLQARGLSLRDFTLLKEAEARGGIQVSLWPIGRGTQLALYPNLNAADPVWRALMREADFRRALSIAIDRDELNRVVYQGTAQPGANTLLPDSPLAKPAYREAWARHDPAAANRLLDGLGLRARGPDGIRRLNDGRPLALVVGTGDTDPAEVDLLELIAAQWRAVGIETLVRPTSRQAFRQRVQSGETVMSLFYGLANGLATADMSPAELAPTSDRQNNWPAWGRYSATNGRSGTPVDTPEVIRLLDLFERWGSASDAAARRAAWDEMLVIHADQVFTIGLVGQVLQPIVRNARLRNLPDRAYYLYEPGAYVGLHRPDTFWFE